jgi:hypothetical protein
MPQSVYLAGLCLLVTASLGCAAHHDYAADSQSQGSQQTVFAPATSQSETRFEIAQQQAAEVAGSDGSRRQVRNEARQAANTLKELVGVVSQVPNANQQVVAGLTRDVAQLSSGLDAIADSRNDQEFTAAVFGMCEPEPIQASNRVGPLLIGLAARLRVNPPANAPADQVNVLTQYFDTLGETLVRIPRQCRRAQEEVTRTKVQAQEDDAGDQAPAARMRARRHRVATSMLDCMAAGMLAPSPNRYQLGTVSRFGYAVQLCQ